MASAAPRDAHRPQRGRGGIRADRCGGEEGDGEEKEVKMKPIPITPPRSVYRDGGAIVVQWADGLTTRHEGERDEWV
jgi:hypothetical protein